MGRRENTALYFGEAEGGGRGAGFFSWLAPRWKMDSGGTMSGKRAGYPARHVVCCGNDLLSPSADKISVPSCEYRSHDCTLFLVRLCLFFLVLLRWLGCQLPTTFVVLLIAYMLSGVGSSLCEYVLFALSSVGITMSVAMHRRVLPHPVCLHRIAKPIF